MLLKFKKLLYVNRDDLALYAGVLGGVFLVTHIITFFAVKFSGEGSSLLLSGAILPVVAALFLLITTGGHVQMTYLHALRMGQTRKRAFTLSASIVLLEGAAAMTFAALLTLLERAFAPSFWMWLAGAKEVAIGRENILVYPEGYVRGDTTLLAIEDFTLAWYWWPLLLLGGIALGLIVGAVTQRFGSRGVSFLWAVYFTAIIGWNALPWRTHEVTNVLIPALVVLVAAGFIWSV